MEWNVTNKFNCITNVWININKKEWKKEFQKITQEKISQRWSDSALKDIHNFYVWMQYNAFVQFKSAADAVKEKGILLKGDIPIMMNEDSADAWAHPEFFDEKTFLLFWNSFSENL